MFEDCKACKYDKQSQNPDILGNLEINNTLATTYKILLPLAAQKWHTSPLMPPVIT